MKQNWMKRLRLFALVASAAAVTYGVLDRGTDGTHGVVQAQAAASQAGRTGPALTPRFETLDMPAAGAPTAEQLAASEAHMAKMLAARGATAR